MERFIPSLLDSLAQITQLLTLVEKYMWPQSSNSSSEFQTRDQLMATY